MTGNLDIAEGQKGVGGLGGGAIVCQAGWKDGLLVGRVGMGIFEAVGDGKVGKETGSGLASGML